MTTADYLRTAYTGKHVTLFCNGAKWISGKLADCTNNTVVIKAKDQEYKIPTEAILSVNP